jgi:hypothetical protein
MLPLRKVCDASVANLTESSKTKHTSHMKWIYYLLIGSKGQWKPRTHWEPVPKAQESCPGWVESLWHVHHLHHHWGAYKAASLSFILWGHVMCWPEVWKDMAILVWPYESEDVAFTAHSAIILENCSEGRMGCSKTMQSCPAISSSMWKSL